MTGAPTKSAWWFLVARETLHLRGACAGAVSWWCVTRGATPGDRCFLYKSLTGVVLYFEVVRITKPEGLCDAFAMATAEIKVLRAFEPPITAKDLKSSPSVGKQGFIRRNFQGKAFTLDKQTSEAILEISTRNSDRRHGPVGRGVAGRRAKTL